MQNFVGKTKCIVGYMKVADTSTGLGRLSALFKLWRAFMVGDARLLILLPLETR